MQEFTKVRGNKISGIIYIIIGIFILSITYLYSNRNMDIFIMIISAFLLFYKGFNIQIQKISITDNQLTHKKLFNTKIINLEYNSEMSF